MTKRRLNSVWQKHISSQISFSSEIFQGSFFPICEMHTRAGVGCVTEQCETDKLSLGIVRFTLKEQSVSQSIEIFFNVLWMVAQCTGWTKRATNKQTIWNIVKCRPLTKHVTNRQTVVGISFNAAPTDWGRDLRRQDCPRHPWSLRWLQCITFRYNVM